MNRSEKIYFLIIVLLIGLTAAGVPHVRQFGMRDGLPSRQVYELQVDSNGYLWVYTLSGIARYDGQQVRSYHLDDIDQSRDYTQAGTTMGLSPEGDAIISIKTGQVYKYNPSLDNFTKIFDFDNHGLPDLRLYSVKFIGDEIVYGTSDGIYCTRNDSVIYHIMPGAPVYDLLDSHNGIWYAATDEGVYYMTKSDRGFKPEGITPGSENNKFRNLSFSRDKLFAGGFSDGLYVYDTLTGNSSKLLTEIANVPVNTLVSDNDSVLYVGFDGAGVYQLDIKSLEVTGHIGFDDTNDGLSANTVTDICTDIDGGLWISTSSHGINYISTHDNVMTAERHNGPNSLLSDYVQSIYEDRDGDIWYGTDFGVSMKDTHGRWRHYLTGSGNGDMNIQTITQSNDGTIWAGGYGSGVWSIDKASGSVRKMPSRVGNTGIGTDYVFMIYPDGDALWVGGIEGDLTRHDQRTGKYTYYPAECVGGMIRVSDNSLYVTGCEGIGIITDDSNSIQWTRHLGKDTILHPTRYVLQDPNTENLWFTTDGDGLIRYDPQGNNITRIYPNSSLTSLPIDGLAQDDKGRIWFCTESDLYFMDSDYNTAVNASSLLGGDIVSILNGTLSVLSNGKIMLGTSDGALILDPSADSGRESTPKLIFNDLIVNNKRITPGDRMLPVAINEIDKIVLSHDNNNFEITFSAIDFSGSHHVNYQWKLQGHDTDWWNTDGNLSAEVRDLSSGKYSLIIRAVDSIDGEELSRRSIPIVVKPPLWATWWAILLYVILACALSVFVIQHIRRRQNELRAKEKLQSFLNIIHDLRTPLTLIKAPLSEVESQESLPEEVSRNVGLAMSNVDRLLGMVSRLLDLRRENDYSDNLNLSETSLRDFIESKVAEHQVAAIQKRLALNVEVPENLPSVRMDCNKISHILDNLLSNAIKYTFSGGVTVKAWIERGYWMISVADTGIGIPRQYHKRIFLNEFRGANATSTSELGSGMGLVIVHRLCRLHKGSVKVVSEENHGTTFTISFPLNISLSTSSMPESGDEPEEMASASHTESKATVMLIDDDHEILDYLSHALSSAYNIISVDNAEEAVNRIKEANPDIVISDVKLPGMSGFELCRQIKSSVETSHIPVILLSGLDERQDMILGLESGANDYIVKPFDISVLRLRIRNILNSRMRARAQFLEASTEAGGEFDDTKLINELDKKFMENLNHVLDEHLSDSEYSITDLCREMAMGRTSLYNKIKALTGVSINEFIRMRRLDKSRELLSSRKYTVSEVAYMVGFSDPKYFSTCFKKLYGVSPSKI